MATEAAPAPDARRLELSVSNFGPIAEGRVELRPFTVFVGPSNTGKSYLATLIYALHRFFGAYAGSSDGRTPPGLPIAMQPNVTIEPSEIDMSENDLNTICAWAEETFPRFESGELRWISSSAIPESVTALLRPTFDVLTQYSGFLNGEILSCFAEDQTENLVRYPMDEAQLELRGSFVKGNEGKVPFRYNVAVNKSGSNLLAAIPKARTFSVNWENIASFRLILHFPWHALRAISAVEIEEKRKLATVLLSSIARAVIADSIHPLDKPAYYLPTDRAGAIRSHQAIVGALIAGASRTATQQKLSGVYGDFLEQLVNLGYSLTQRTELHPLSRQMEQDILDGDIRIENNAVGYPSFLYRPSDWQRDLPLMNASSMVSELAPVVLHLRHVVQPGDTLIIEEPESHLHPTMQVEFTRLLAAAVKAGVRVIITTHSEWILEELANLVRLSELPEELRNGIADPHIDLSHDEVGAWFFERNDEAGGSVVREIPLDTESGTFPAGYGLVTESLYKRWSTINRRVRKAQ